MSRAQTLLTILAVSLVLGALGFVLAPVMLKQMGVSPQVYDGALSFMRVIFAALPFTFIYAMAQGLMRGVGEVKAPLYICRNGLRELRARSGADLRPLRRARLGRDGCRRWRRLSPRPLRPPSRSGSCSAAATAIHIHWRDFVPDPAFVKRAILLGYPASIEQSARGAGHGGVLTFLIVGFGTVVTASFGVASNVFNVMIIPAMGFSMATSTLVGQNIGAGNLARAEKVARLSAAITFGVLTGFGIVCFAFAPSLVRFFIPGDAEVVRQGAAYIRIVAWSFGFIGLQFALTGRAARGRRDDPRDGDRLVSQWGLQIPLGVRAVPAHAARRDGDLVVPRRSPTSSPPSSPGYGSCAEAGRRAG